MSRGGIGRMMIRPYELRGSGVRGVAAVCWGNRANDDSARWRREFTSWGSHRSLRAELPHPAPRNMGLLHYVSRLLSVNLVLIWFVISEYLPFSLLRFHAQGTPFARLDPSGRFSNVITTMATSNFSQQQRNSSSDWPRCSVPDGYCKTSPVAG